MSSSLRRQFQLKADNTASRLLCDLRAFDDLVTRLSKTAPAACRRYSGAEQIVFDFGGRPTCVGYWLIDFQSQEGIAVWEALAEEQQAAHRVYTG